MAKDSKRHRIIYKLLLAELTETVEIRPPEIGRQQLKFKKTA